MARALVLCQTRNPDTPKLQIRGVFTQKKKLWIAITSLAGDLTGWKIFDDVQAKEYDANYNSLCNRLRINGRTTIINPEGVRIFLVVDSQMNSLRDWDTDNENKPKLNPLGGTDDDEEK
jgi:hypothetical protein